MCYSALVKQDLTKYGLKNWAVRMDYDMILEMFEQRRKGAKLSVPKAFEQNFKNPTTPIEKKISKSIDEYRTNQIAELETDLFKQKTRHNKARELNSQKNSKWAGRGGKKGEYYLQRRKTKIMSATLTKAKNQGFISSLFANDAHAWGFSMWEKK